MNSGTLRLGNAAALGSGAVTVNGTLDLNGKSLTVPAIGGNVTGLITNSNASGNSAAAVLSANIATGTSTYGGAINNGSGGTVALVKNGSGNLNLTGTSSFSGGTTLNAGTLSFSSGALGAGPITIAANNTTLRWNTSNSKDTSTQGLLINDLVTATLDTNGNNVSLASSLQNGPAGTGALTKIGTGALSLGGSNTYSGATTLLGGQLNINSPSAIGTGMLILNNGTSIDNTSGAPVTLSTANPVNIIGGFTFAGTNPLDLGTGPVTGATININVAAGNLTLSGPYATGGGLANQVTTKSGNGTLTIASTTSTFNAIWNFNAGTVNVASLSDYGVPGSLGNRGIGADNATDVALTFFGGTLQYTGSTPQASNRAIRMGVGNSTTLDASGTDPSATMSFTALSSPALNSGTGARTLTLTGTNTGRNTYNIALTDQSTVTGQTSLTKNGPGTWVLTNTHSYSGNTTINQGTLEIGTAFGGSSLSNVVLAGGKLSSGGLDQSLGTLTLSANSTVDLGIGGRSTTRFAASSATNQGIVWMPGTTLTIDNWTNGFDHLFVGFSNVDLDAAQVAQITFAGIGAATIDAATGEILPVLPGPVFKRGDVNFDTHVNAADITAMLSALTNIGAYKTLHGFNDDKAFSLLDANADGLANNLDVQGLIDYLIGGNGSTNPVPEPSSMALLALGTLLGLELTRRRRRVAS